MERKLDPPLYMGLTLKSLLEKSDVLNTVNSVLKPKEDGQKKDDDPWGVVDGQSAFLGPNLWDRDMFFDGDLKMEYMDLDEFLSETGIPQSGGEGRSPKSPEIVNVSPPRIATPPSVNNDPVLIAADLPVATEEIFEVQVPSPVELPTDLRKCASTKTPARRARKSVPVPLVESPEPCSSDLDLSMSSSSFDPRYHSFSEDELKPQPAAKKSKKQYVPDDMKDDKYWARRRKNNMAAKRSRDARRMKENQIALRAVFLEKENASLKAEVERLRKENQLLKMKK